MMNRMHSMICIIYIYIYIHVRVRVILNTCITYGTSDAMCVEAVNIEVIRILNE